MDITPTTRRSTSSVSLALFAASGFLMFCALVLLSPFAVSPYAEQNDVYMGNLFIGLPVFIIGSLLFAISLAGLGLRPDLTVLVALVSLLVGVALWLGVIGWSISTHVYVAGAAALVLLVLSWAIARGHARMKTWRRGLALALLGSGIIALLYVLFGGHYASAGGVVVSWPPYLMPSITGVSIALAVAIFVLGWRWGETGPRRGTPPASA
ncbi:MAG TPA: hypothetical protein VFU63_06900 [Ktedonobacterales bacterium]|nr:hypothetical protein [Ktedonobacterales bacterium]